MTKVGKSDCEATFAGASGNDEDAPVTAIGARAMAAKSNPSVNREQNPPRLDGCDLRLAGCALGILS